VSEIATIVNARGQISMPAPIRRELGLRPGQALLWTRVSDTEVRIRVPARGEKPSMRGVMKKFLAGGPRRTAGWMKFLREGERAEPTPH